MVLDPGEVLGEGAGDLEEPGDGVTEALAVCDKDGDALKDKSGEGDRDEPFEGVIEAEILDDGVRDGEGDLLDPGDAVTETVGDIEETGDGVTELEAVAVDVGVGEVPKAELGDVEGGGDAVAVGE